MIYRIDIQHYLNHAIDHFTREELTHFEYAIISAKIKNGGRVQNMTRINDLYPDADIVTSYIEYKDPKLFEEMYMDQLHPVKKNNKGEKYDHISGIIYKIFVIPMKLHQDIVIICDASENLYVDVFCKLLKKEYGIEVIDLNKLFSEGSVGPIYIDREQIQRKAVDAARNAAKETLRRLSSTKEGRLKIISNMNKKEKIAKLKELGITVGSADKNEIDKMLVEEWVNNEFDDE